MYVIYNGGTQSYYGCSDPWRLIKGKEYKVIGKSDRGWQTDYYLQGIPGAYNSVWFDEILPVYFATSNKAPVEGERYRCNKLSLDGLNGELIGWHTSRVKSVELIGQNTYKVLTQNSIYLVTIK